LHFDVVSARLQNREIVDACLVAYSSANEVRCGIRYCNSDTGNDCAGGIMNNTAHAGFRLPESRQQSQRRNTQDSPNTPLGHGLLQRNCEICYFAVKSNRPCAGVKNRIRAMQNVELSRTSDEWRIRGLFPHKSMRFDGNSALTHES